MKFRSDSTAPESRLPVLGKARLVALACLMSLVSCKPAEPPQTKAAPAPVEVETAPVRRAAVEELVEATGTIFAQQDIIVSSKLTGRMSFLAVDIGDVVNPGDLLAQMETQDYQLALTERQSSLGAALAKIGLTELPADDFDPTSLPTVALARTEALNAEARLSRAKQLFEASPPLIAAQDYADIQTAFDVAQRRSEIELLAARSALAEARAQAAAVATAQQRLADAAIKAPVFVEGADQSPLRYRIAERLVSTGEFVEPGRSLFRLVASDLVELRVSIPERYATQVKLGMIARVVTQNESTRVEGRISRISPTVDPLNRRFLAEILIPNPDALLKPGAFAWASIETGSRDNVPMVPASAVVSFAGVNRVFSVADGKAVEHRVKLGIERQGAVEIIGKFDADEVIIRGQSALATNTPVTVKATAATRSP